MTPQDRGLWQSVRRMTQADKGKWHRKTFVLKQWIQLTGRHSGLPEFNVNRVSPAGKRRMGDMKHVRTAFERLFNELGPRVLIRNDPDQEFLMTELLLEHNRPDGAAVPMCRP